MGFLHIMDNILNKARFSARFWWKKAEKAFKALGYDIGEMPEVSINNRLTSTAGRAWAEDGKGKIDLSRYLMERYPEYFTRDTIPHELAHIISNRLFNDGMHKAGWKFTVQTMGCKTTRCHNMPSKYDNEKGLI